MRYLLTYFTLLYSSVFSFCLGQDKTDIYILPASAYLFPKEVSSHYLLADSVSLRENPSSIGRFLGVLRAGAKVMVLEDSDSISTIKGIKSKWYKIKTQEGDTQRVGWVWGGFIASHAFKSKDNLDVKFLIGLDRISKHPKYEYQFEYKFKVKAIQDSILISEKIIDVPASYVRDVKSLGNAGLNNLDDIIAIGVPCASEGCGCPTGIIYLFWNNNEFVQRLDAIGFPDAEFSESTEYIFPSDLEGEKGMIIKRISMVDQKKQKMVKQDDDTVHRIYSIEYYKWNSKELTKASKKGIIKKYTITTPFF
ncbi:SH3 domain-containing protein [Bernardetia sp.]|uniref:SH3 domain-containing protein n=1 Tax=Bernardetia sp. TaxID=1937974 RepID=UPI0025C01DDA|nr:SH3 domain-containing protein [Bernardetia sp.]